MFEDGAADAPERDVELPFALLDSNGEACLYSVTGCLRVSFGRNALSDIFWSFL
jgi:hypothetical protein